MKNNFITKIIGATLAFAMMIGGAVGINTAKQAKEVNAADGDSPIVLDGSSLELTSTATTAETTKTYGGVTYKVSSGAKAQSSSGSNKFNANSAILIGKSGAYIYNSTALPGTITKLEVFANSGASAKVSVGVKFATSAITTWNATGAWTQTLSSLDHVYDASSAIVSGANYFRYQVTNANNSQIQIRITYTAGGGDTPTTYSVTYNDGGATSGTAPEDNTSYENNATVTVLGNTGNLAKTDYTFGGWTDGEHEYQPGNTFSISSNKELTAIWNLDEGFDALTRSFTGINNGAQYGGWSNKEGQSGAVYAGNSGGGNDSIQLRTDNSNSGVVTTTSGGNVKKVSVIWNDATAEGRTLNVYAKNTAYSSAADLYDANSQGTLVGTIVNGTSTSIALNANYRYVGVRSDDKAMYLTELHFKWEEAQLNPRVELNPSSLTLKTNQTNGASVTALVEDVETPTYSWVANNSNVTLENANTATVTIKPNTQVAANSTVTLTVGGVTPNLVETLNVTIEIPGPGETAETAFTVAQARAHIDGGTDDNWYYATGIVSEIVEAYNPSYHNISYNISSDGLTTSDQLQAYRGKGIDGANFASEDDIVVGDIVVIYGQLTKYNDTYEFAQNNQLVSRATINSITLTPSSITLAPNASGDVTDLFTSIVIDQDDGLNKTQNDIVWSVEDESVLLVDEGEFAVMGEHRESTTLYASINGKVYGSATINIIDPNIHSISYNTTSLNKATSISIGDQVVFVHEGSKNELTSVTTTGTTVGAVTEYATNPSGSFMLTIVAGNANNSYAFKTPSNTYLSWSSGNSLTTSDQINNASSWTITNDNGDFKFTNVGTTSRVLQYNSGNPRFACYTSDQSAFQIYKKVENNNVIDFNSFAEIKSAYEDENNAYIRLGVSLSEEDWAAMNSAFGIAGYGVMLIRETTLETTGFDSIEELYNSDSENKTKLSNLGKNSETAPQDFSVAAKINIKNESDRNVTFCAAVYVKSSSGAIYFINETRGSLVGLL